MKYWVGYFANLDPVSLVEMLPVFRSRAWRIIWRSKKQRPLREDILCAVTIIMVAVIIRISELLVLGCNSGSRKIGRNKAGHRDLRTRSYLEFWKWNNYFKKTFWNIFMGEEKRWVCSSRDRRKAALHIHVNWMRCSWEGYVGTMVALWPRALHSYMLIILISL